MLSSNKNIAPISLKAWLGEVLRQGALLPAIKNLYCPLRVKGLENLPVQGPFILVANHSSHLDTPMLLAALPLRLRLRLRIAAASDYFFKSVWKGALFSTLVNAFPFVRKGEGSITSLQQTQQLLQQGYSVALFPEGTRTLDGQIHLFKHGIGYLAINAHAPVLPTYIAGTWQAMPKGTKWPRHYPVTITFGKPLTFSPSLDSHQIAAILEQEVRSLAGERPSDRQLQAA
jgi:1-acyl-sn-glycerol-3-phosphate acyltransferase